LDEENGVLQARLKLLDEYTSDLRVFQEVNFREYQENKIIRRAVERTLHLAGFRNLIVHDYSRIYDGAVFGILKKRLGDFDLFAGAIVRYIES